MAVWLLGYEVFCWLASVGTSLVWDSEIESFSIEIYAYADIEMKHAANQRGENVCGDIPDVKAI